MTTSTQISPLPAVLRFYVYGIQGFCDEIIFTSILDFFTKEMNWQLKGHSAVSSFFIYGTICFLVERLYVFLYYKHGIKRHFRLPLYLVICYSWEFCTGLLLRQFNACPWDYSEYRYNFLGLVTLEYAPGWLFLSWLQDELADYLLRIRVCKQIHKGTQNIKIYQSYDNIKSR